MSLEQLVFRVHAITRMFERGITETEVRLVLENGEIIEQRADAFPYPSRLVLGCFGSRPLHVVAADNGSEDETIIVTVYEPDPARWEHGFTRRKTT